MLAAYLSQLAAVEAVHICSGRDSPGPRAGLQHHGNGLLLTVQQAVLWDGVANPTGVPQVL